MPPEYNILHKIFDFLTSLNISKCQVAIDKLKVAGKNEKIPTTYCVAELPNGIVDYGAYIFAKAVITIGANDKTPGLPNINEITRISKTIGNAFPVIIDDLKLINFTFASDNYDGIGTHEFYYTFEVYYSGNK